MKIDEELKSNFKSPQQRAIVNIRFTSNYLGNIQNQFMSKYDLSMAQFNILRIIRGAKDTINVNTVKERMIEKSPNTTRLMDKLIDKTLIERVRCEEDRRVVYVEINKRGLELLDKIDLHFEQQMNFAHHLSEEESDQLNDLLD